MRRKGDDKLRIVSLRPAADFIKLGVTVPAGVEITFSTATEEDGIIDACAEADVLIPAKVTGDIITSPITASIIERASHLKLIQVTAVGYDNVDIVAAAQKGIPVANAKGANRAAVCELVILQALAYCRRLIECDAGLKRGEYAETRSKAMSKGMYELPDLTIGIVGLGDIGKGLAKRLRGFETTVQYYDIVRPSMQEELDLGVKFTDFERLLSTSDIVTLHVSLSAQTKYMIGAGQLNVMKPNALLINAARGPVVDAWAAAKALMEGKIGGLALDVHETEPLPRDNPFASLPEEAKSRLILTPHIAGTSGSSQLRMLQYGLDNIGRLAKGLRPINVVNGMN